MNIYTPTIAYLYKWTNTETNRWYIGSRTKRGCHPNDGYICSSRTVKPLILEHKEQWTRTILCLGTPEYILALETRLLTAVDAKNDPLSYNQHNGDGKFTSLGRPCTFKGKKLGPQSLEACLKRSIAMKGKNKGKTPWNKGKKLTKEHLANRQASRKDYTAWNKGLTLTDEKYKVAGRKNKGKTAWNKGKSPTPEAEAKRLASRAANAAKKKAP
jgi:hypothetical protein